MAFGYSNDNFLHEAFKDLNAINEEVFDISQDGDKKLKAFLDGDVLDDTQEIVDKDATTEDDLQDSYLGKVILDCCVCHTLLYKDKNDIVLDDEEEYANVGEECPFCHNEEGFKIVGEVTEYDEENDHDDEEEDDDETEVEIKKDSEEKFDDDVASFDFEEEEKVEESLKEGFYDDERKGKFHRCPDIVWADDEKTIIYNGRKLDGDAIEGELWGIYSEKNNIPNEKFNDPMVSREFDKYVCTDGKKFLDGILADEKKYGYLIKESVSKTDDIDAEADDKKELAKKRFMRAKDDADSDREYRMKKGITRRNESKLFKDIKESKSSKEELPSELTIGIEVFVDSDEDAKELAKNDLALQEFIDTFLEDTYGKKTKDYSFEYNEDGEYVAVDNIVWDLDEGKKCESIDHTFYLEVVKKDGGKSGTDRTVCKELKLDSVIRAANGETLADDEAFLLSDAVTGKQVGPVASAEQLAAEAKKIFESKASEIVRDEIDAEADDKKEAARKAFKRAEDDADSDRDYRLKKGITRTNESVEEVKVVTDKEEVGVKTDEEGKVTVETSPRKEESGETIEPISDEVKADIEAGSAEDEIEGEIGDEVEVDIDDFDEESFDELGEAFLKKSYSNVEGYHTTSATATGNKLVIEGVIKFKSGNEKPTSFILESRDITKSGRSRFIGENRQLCNAKKAFSVRGQIKEGRFISESLNYDYRARDAKTGNPKRISGTVTVGK